MSTATHALLERAVAARLATWGASPSRAYVLTWGRARLVVGIA